MPTYNLERWDSVIPIGKNYAYPMVYFKPDDEFLSYAEKNNFLIKCTISGTSSSYDTNSVLGVIDQSGNFPNNRPNFFKDTNYYVITLLTDWVGYPPSNGSIFIQGQTGENSIKQDLKQTRYESPSPIPWEMYEKRDSNDSFSNDQLKLIGFLIFIIFCIFITKLYTEKK